MDVAKMSFLVIGLLHSIFASHGKTFTQNVTKLLQHIACPFLVGHEARAVWVLEQIEPQVSSGMNSKPSVALTTTTTATKGIEIKKANK